MLDLEVGGRPVWRRRAILMAVGGALVLAGAALSCARGQVKRPDGGEGLLPVGAMAPEIVAKDAKGAEVRLSSLRGRPVVVYFYPKDGTPGCTAEACAFRDAWDRFGAAGIGIVGVSRDSEESHRAFIVKHKLPFALAADEDGAHERAYGVPSMMGMSGRVTFLVAPDGKVAASWPDVDPAIHAGQVLDTAKKLGGTSPPEAGVGQGSE
jgi:peroxiredoxin Q/BCP